MLERHMAYTTMLVDDDADIRRLLRVVLDRTWAFRVIAEAENAVVAFELLDEGWVPKPELVLLDWLMPFVEGREAYDGLRMRLPEAVVVVLTVVPDIAKAGLPAGAPVVDKALTPMELVVELYRAVGGVDVTSSDLER